ncbi:MAG: NTP transferase domain-containing protein [Chitinispirillales bacterium]|jgi:mannose-1-phosphate guanylyltransferase|nr:NTP transferase domain-containing protein [Chitinispirillales bacterium]
MQVIPVILAGGIGERFWPMSRSASPKQLHAIGSDKSMLEETILRVESFCSDSVKPVLITGAGIAEKVAETLGGINDKIEIIAEPAGKNTAPAIAIAAAMLKHRHDDAVMVVVSADHAITPTAEFAKAVDTAVNTAKTHGGLVVFGIKPSRPETGYGYIELGGKIQAGATGECAAFEVKRFVEKPNAENAEKFMSSGNFLWNSGMFVWTASAILEEFRQHMPDLYGQAMDAAKKDFSQEAINEFYSVCRKESIDFGIMEKAGRVSAVRGDFFWDDLGSWESLSRVHGSNDSGTTVTGPLIYESGCTDSLIVNKSARTLAAVGLQNVAVIAVDDALLVIDRSRLPDLKKYLSEIKDSKNFSDELF